MGQPNFDQPPAHPVAQRLHNDINAVDGDTTEGVHHGLPAELEPKALFDKSLKKFKPLKKKIFNDFNFLICLIIIF